MSFFSEIFLKDNKIGKHYFAALDLGTEIVKVLIFDADYKEKKIIIKGIGKEFHKPGNFQGSFILNQEGIASTCRKALKKAKRMAGLELKGKNKMRTVLGVSGELAEVAVITFSHQRKKSQTRISQLELKEIAQKANQQISDSVKYRSKKDNGKKGEVRFLNIDISEMSVDGYQVVDLAGLKGEKVEMQMRGSYMLADNFKMIESIADLAGLELIKVVYNPCVTAKAVCRGGESGIGAIFIDIGGSITDVALVKNGIVEFVKTFALGGKIFAGKAGGKNNLRFDQKIIDLVPNTETGKEQHLNYKLWFSGVEFSLKAFSKNSLLPLKIFVYGGGSCFPKIAESLERMLKAKKLSFVGNPQVKFICPKDIMSFTDQTKELVHPQDLTPLSIALSVLDSRI